MKQGLAYPDVLFVRPEEEVVVWLCGLDGGLYQAVVVGGVLTDYGIGSLDSFE